MLKNGQCREPPNRSTLAGPFGHEPPSRQGGKCVLLDVNTGSGDIELQSKLWIEALVSDFTIALTAKTTITVLQSKLLYTRSSHSLRL
jgi:hypothetical protein